MLSSIARPCGPCGFNEATLSEDRTADGGKNQQEGRPQARKTGTLHLYYVNAIFLYKIFFVVVAKRMFLRAAIVELCSFGDCSLEESLISFIIKKWVFVNGEK